MAQAKLYISGSLAIKLWQKLGYLTQKICMYGHI